MNYLDPENHPATPLVELPDGLNPFRTKGVRIMAKLMSATPLLNVKSVPAYNMLKQAQSLGRLDGKTHLIENSSGNTVYSLSVIGKVMSGLETCAYVSNEITEGKLKLLRFFGVSPIVNEEPICPDPADKTSGIYKAQQRAKDDEQWFNPGQYDNPDNPAAHQKITGKQIWEQTEGQIGLFCAGLGTTGTMTGTAEYLKNNNPDLATLGVIRAPNNSIPGPRTRNLLSQIAFNWEGVVDNTVEIGSFDAYATSLKLCRHGLLVGPSSGFALAGLLNFLKEHLTDIPGGSRDENGDLICVFICCDTPLPYLDDYFSVLDEEYFPKIENQELLLFNKADVLAPSTPSYDLKPQDAWQRIYTIDQKQAWQQLERGQDVNPKDEWVIVDLRRKDQFEHAHLPGSINILYNEFNSEAFFERNNDKKVLLVCSWGLKSRQLCSQLRFLDIEAHSLEGGISIWSAEQLPRWRPQVCHLNHPTHI